VVTESAQETSALPQGVAPAAPEKSPPINGVALVVNERCITLLQLYIGAQRRARLENRPMQQADLEAELEQRAKDLLMEQGGRDKGFPAEQVQRLVERQIERQQDATGGILRFADFLQERDQDSFEYRDSVESYIYGRIWQESESGLYPGPKGRLYKDRYVRPGRLRFEFEEMKARGALDRTFEITEVTVGLTQAGGMDEADRLLQSIAADVRAGADMGAIAELQGAKAGSRGRASLNTSQLATFGQVYPELAEFLGSAAAGELSPILPIWNSTVLTQEGRRDLVGFRLLRLDEVLEPRFDDWEWQSQFERTLMDRRDELRTVQGLRTLFEGAYVWPPDAFGPQIEGR
jgi:hypothetical protein